MKKETIIKIFEENKSNNFSIVTNIGKGKGINGVSFVEYYGESIWNGDKERTRVLGFMEDCIVLEHYKNNSYWQGGTHKIYLPFDSILAIDIITEHSNENAFPKLSVKHNLNDIK